MPNNSIANFAFIRLTPPPILPAKQWQMEARSGVNSVTLFDTGARGEPYQCRTIVDCLSLADASALVAAYYESVNSNELVQVVYAGRLSPVLYKVVSVVTTRMNKIAGGVGGVNATSTAILECQWILQPIGPLPEEE